MTDRSGWSFHGGSWFGIFGENATVVLPPSEKARVAALWELLDDGAGFDETLDALISSGLRGLPGFVLVAAAGDDTRVVLRGAARTHLATPDDVVLLEGDSATTWVERGLHGVSRIRIEVAEDTGPQGLVVGSGLVRIATAQWPPVTSGREAPAVGPLTEPIAQPVAAAPPPSPAVVALDVPAPEDEDHDGLTRTGGPDPGEPAHQHPGIPGQPPPPPVTARPVARLVLSSGESVDVDRPVLLGRAPEAPRPTSTEQPRLVTVPSPHQEISSTHLEVRPGSGADHGSAVVTDLGSTNGTVLVQPGLPPEELKVGVPVQLIPGAILDLGDGLTIRVVNA